MNRKRIIRMTIILLVLISSCQKPDKILFTDSLNGTVSDGWIIAPNNFINFGSTGKFYYLKCDSVRLDTIAPWVGSTDWANHSVEFEMMITEKKGFVGFDYNMQDEDDFGCNFHFAAFRDTVTFQSMGMWGINKGSWKLWPVSQKSVVPKLNEWMKFKLEVGDDFANIFVNDTCKYTIYDTPFSNGGIRFWASYYGGAFYRNIKVIQVNSRNIKPILKDEWEDVRELDIITKWLITDIKADTFAIVDLPNKSLLDNENWTEVNTDNRGVLNIGAIYPNYTTNTVLAKSHINISEEKEVSCYFTYTDRFKLYCNNEEVFVGPDRNWWNPERAKYGNSRLIPDQFEIKLSLKKGENEIIVRSEVMEDFGWGFCIRIDDE